MEDRVVAPGFIQNSGNCAESLRLSESSSVMASSMSTSQRVLPSFSATKNTNFDTTRCQLLSSSLWGSPISISSFSSSPKMSLQFQTRRRLSVTAMAPPKAKPGGKAKKGNFTFNSIQFGLRFLHNSSIPLMGLSILQWSE